MARTFRTYWDSEGNLIADHRDGRTGWVSSPRAAERAAKRSERQAAKIAARQEISESA